MSHVFTANSRGILRPDGAVLPELRNAMEKSVILDVVNGMVGLSYDMAAINPARALNIEEQK